MPLAFHRSSSETIGSPHVPSSDPHKPVNGAPMNLATVCYILVSIAAVIYILDFLGVV